MLRRFISSVALAGLLAAVTGCSGSTSAPVGAAVKPGPPTEGGPGSQNNPTAPKPPPQPK
jgi:hypothetical protein